MFAHRSITAAALSDLERIEQAVRCQYAVPEAQIVLVTQEPTRMLGGPVVMTTILFWTDPETRHKVRVFKPAHDVRASDLPPGWLRRALLDDVATDCC
ncbi:MAG: hypothetical protein WBA67_08435 [Jannaschia sp.]